MTLLPLPNLDDRRWLDLVEEGRAMIPLYEQAWTDHNIHDPGIMLLELLAWIAEMDIYWLNRIPERHVRKFLALAGVSLQPPRPARAALQILLADTAGPLELPAGFQFEGDDVFQRSTPFRTLHSVTLAPGRLVAIERQVGSQREDLTPAWQRGETLALFGENPQPGASFYLGFSQPLPKNLPVSLHFQLLGAPDSATVREHLTHLYYEQHLACLPPRDCPPPGCRSFRPLPLATEATDSEPDFSFYHCVQLQWAYQDRSGDWRDLPPEAIQEETGAFGWSGRIQLTLPGKMHPSPSDRTAEPRFFLRCRLAGGVFEATPILRSLAFNGVEVEQAIPLGEVRFTIDPAAIVDGVVPARGEPAAFQAEFDASGRITGLTFVSSGPPGLVMLRYRPPEPGRAGFLHLQAAALPFGDGRPGQIRTLEHGPVQSDSLHLVTWEAGVWVTWQAVADFDNSTHTDAHFILDAARGELHFGDGNRGRVLPHRAWPLVSYRSTRAELGNLPPGAINRWPENSHNRAQHDNLIQVRRDLVTVENLLAAGGGTGAETIQAASARLRHELNQSERLVTGEDYQRLALETPGRHVARVGVFANLHPAFPCYQAPGIVTVVVLPYLPAGRPEPSPCLLHAVFAYLNSRRVPGTRVMVVGPEYVRVTVQAVVQGCAGAHRADLQKAIVEALHQFFNPLRGGPDGAGWPFGRDVFRAEVLQVIDEIVGVDHVLSLALSTAGEDAQCGNLCLGPLGLVESGAHQIEVR